MAHPHVEHPREAPYRYFDRRANRMMVTFTEGGRKVTSQYARWLYEKHFGILAKNVFVHHINGDTMDDRLENFQLLTNSEHALLHMKAKPKYREVFELEKFGLRRCRKCKKVLPLSEFYYLKKRGVHFSRCRICCIKYQHGLRGKLL
jgi:hypothetical protein